MPATARLSVFGLSEDEVTARLGDLATATDVDLDLETVLGLVQIRLRTTGGDAASLVTGLRRRLGAAALGRATLEESVGSLLLERGLTLGVAESLTGGLIGKLLTDVPGISACFTGSLVTYADQAKIDVLGVPAERIASDGAVSGAVAMAMASGVRRTLRSDLGVALTGIAGPGGGTPEKPVGLVWFALAVPGGAVTPTSMHIEGDRETVRGLSANFALDMVRRWLRNP